MRLSLSMSVFLAIAATSPLPGCENDSLTEGAALDAFGVDGPLDQVGYQGDVGPTLSVWTDPNSGLEWQVTPTGGTMDYLADAKAHCSSLALDGGGWRLPDIGELRSLIRGCAATEDGGSCNISAGECLDWGCRAFSCSGCNSGEGPEGGCYWPTDVVGECSWYWSSSPAGGYYNLGWSVFFDNGIVSYDFDGGGHVRCVR